MLAIFAVTLVLSAGLTLLVGKAATRRGLVDVPGEERRVHSVAVPRLGGLAMFGAFAVGVGLLFLVNIWMLNPTPNPGDNTRFEPWRILFVLLGAAVVTLVMAVDDVRGLRPLTRLLWQVGAALLVILPALVWPGGPNEGEAAGTVHYDQGAGVIALSVQNPFGGSIEFPLVIAVILTAFWLVGVTNTINWIDGLDGLAAGVSAVACAVMFVITGPILGQWTLAYLPLVLGAAVLGFLPFNIHPARIFMGDSGAMFLGFTLAVIAIIGGAKMAAALLVLGIPLLDGVYMIIYRLYRGRSPLQADRGHLHHRLLDIGLSQPRVVAIFYALCGTFGILAFLLTSSADTLTLFGLTLSASDIRLIKLAALVLMALMLMALLIFISRRRFDRASLRDRAE
jgi:UDP-N-acetylmuramyl pentapeptide phosphotransferase/UDP-N-acetylglucosamine-1-phosphate transferase